MREDRATSCGLQEVASCAFTDLPADMGRIVGMGVVGVVQAVPGSLGHAESAQFELIPDPSHAAMAGIATAFLLLRAFSSGCAALTGGEAISNGGPAFQKPKSRNAATTLLMMAPKPNGHKPV